VERCWTELIENRGHTRYHFKVRAGKQCYRLREDLQSGNCIAWAEAR